MQLSTFDQNHTFSNANDSLLQLCKVESSRLSLHFLQQVSALIESLLDGLLQSLCPA